MAFTRGRRFFVASSDVSVAHLSILSRSAVRLTCQKPLESPVVPVEPFDQCLACFAASVSNVALPCALLTAGQTTSFAVSALVLRSAGATSHGGVCFCLESTVKCPGKKAAVRRVKFSSCPVVVAAPLVGAGSASAPAGVSVIRLIATWSVAVLHAAPAWSPKSSSPPRPPQLRSCMNPPRSSLQSRLDRLHWPVASLRQAHSVWGAFVATVV